MKETPTEQREEERAQAAAAASDDTITPTTIPEPDDAPPVSQLEPISQPEPTSDLASQPQDAANGKGAEGNGHLSPAQPVLTRPLAQPAPPKLTRPLAQPAPPKLTRPLAQPARGRLGHRRSPFSRQQKSVIISLLVVAFVAALPIGAYLAMQVTERQQARVVAITPVATDLPTLFPKSLDPAHQEAIFINQMISRMSLDEELGQMIMVEWDEGGVFDNDLRYMLVNEHAGGIILYTFNGNIQTRAQVTALTAAIQSHAQIPLLISIDQEGGEVNRLDPITGPRPSARAIGASNDPNRAYQQGTSDGQILKQLGINDNLAPDVDVQSLSDAAFNNSSMAGFEYRMYGSTPDKVATFAGAYLNGLQAQGIIGTLKHWPGLGADTVDPHDALPTIHSSQAQLNSVNFAPYRTLLAEGNVDMIMSTHELVPAYDKTYPATLSPVLIDQVLRGDLGYQGVIITDGLYMKAISDHWTLAQAAVLAVQAGNDILLGPYDTQGVQNVLNALHAAVSNGKISKARIDLSVARILALKIKYGMIKMPTQA